MDQAVLEAAGYSLPPDRGEGISANRVKLVIILAVLIGSFVYLSFIAFQSATRFYYTVGELQEVGPSEEARIVRVNGKLVEGSFVRESGETIARFTLTDGTATLAASHDGVLPDLFFNEHTQITLEGSYEPDGTFRSHQVTIKCPSKYIGVG